MTAHTSKTGSKEVHVYRCWIKERKGDAALDVSAPDEESAVGVFELQHFFLLKTIIVTYISN